MLNTLTKKAILKYKRFEFFFLSYLNGQGELSRGPIHVLLRVVFSTIKGFFVNSLQNQATVLAFYTLFAIFPFLILVLGVGKSLGMQDGIKDLLLTWQPAQGSIFDMVYPVVDSFFDHIKDPFVLVVSIGTLLWAIMRVLMQIDTSFNDIWNITDRRSYWKRFLVYFSFVVFLPVFLIASSMMNIFLHSEMIKLFSGSLIEPVWKTALQRIPWLVNIVLFTLMYWFFPNVKVKFKEAIWGGIVAGVVLQVFQILYINGQIWVSGYSIIYGGFVAVPLLLLYVQFSWLTILAGAEVVYALRSHGTTEFKI